MTYGKFPLEKEESPGSALFSWPWDSPQGNPHLWLSRMSLNDGPPGVTLRDSPPKGVTLENSSADEVVASSVTLELRPSEFPNVSGSLPVVFKDEKSFNFMLDTRFSIPEKSNVSESIKNTNVRTNSEDYQGISYCVTFPEYLGMIEWIKSMGTPLQRMNQSGN